MPGSTASGIAYAVVGDAPDVPATTLAMANSLEPFVATPLCKLILAANFGVANNNNAISIPFGSGSEAMKSHAGMHSTTVNSTRIIPPTPGIYVCKASTAFAINTSGFRAHTIGKNGVRQAPEQGIYNSAALPSGGTGCPLPIVEVELTANGTTDYFELFAYQNSGGVLNALGDGSSTTTMNTVFTVKYDRPLIP